MEEQAKQGVVAKDDLDTEYANNVYFDATVWDLKLIFGEYSTRSNVVDYHTSITLPWAQAKLMHYYLGLNLAAHELRTGSPISIPIGARPPEAIPPSGTDDTQENREFFKMVQEQRGAFLKTIK